MASESDMHKIIQKLRLNCRLVGECRLWDGRVDGSGYGQVTCHGVFKPVHRWMYMYIHGADSDDTTTIEQTCSNRRCIAPAHLKLVARPKKTVYVAPVRRRKLTEQQVIEIRAIRSRGYTFVEIAELYGVSHTTIYTVVNEGQGVPLELGIPPRRVPEEAPRIAKALNSEDWTDEHKSFLKDTLSRNTTLSEMGCMLWTKARHVSGAGVYTFKGKTYQTHRLCYLVFMGPIPAGYSLGHTCPNLHCCHKDHLLLASYIESTHRDRQTDPAMH